MNNERYKQLMNDVGLPNSLSLLTALRQVENEVSQPLLAENERLRAALIFIRDKEQAALNEAESLRFNIPEEAGCMEILHAARAALEGKP